MVADTSTTDVPKEMNKPVRPSWRDAVAGATAGAFSRTVTAPVERLKLLLQLQHSLDIPATKQQQQRPVEQAFQRNNAWQVARSIYHTEGLLSFWRGNLPSVLRVSGAAAINFTMMDYYKAVAVKPFVTHWTDDRYRNMVTSFVSGGLAGATTATILYPVDFLRTRLAADLARQSTTTTTTSTIHKKATKKDYQFRGMRHALWSILQSDGMVGIYQGYGIALWGGFLYRLLFLGGYDVLKAEWMDYKKLKNIELESNNNNSQQQSPPAILSFTWAERYIMAQFISLTAGTICYPIDSVRRRLMMQSGKPKEQRRYRNSWHCIYVVGRDEGIKGFFLGLGPNILRSVSGALLLVVYDDIREAIV